MYEYRMDGRTVEEFKRDIKVGNEREQRALNLFKGYLQREFNFKGDIHDNGCDMSGEFIADDRKVTAGADYVFGANKLPLEIKTSVSHATPIYLKVNQVKSYIKQNASILYVNGVERRRPAFTFFTVEDLRTFESKYEKVNPPNGINGGKLSYKINALDLTWSNFDGKEKVYHEFS